MMGMFEYFVLGLLTMLVADNAEEQGRQGLSVLLGITAAVWLVVGAINGAQELLA